MFIVFYEDEEDCEDWMSTFEEEESEEEYIVCNLKCLNEVLKKGHKTQSTKKELNKRMLRRSYLQFYENQVCGCAGVGF